MDAAFLLLVLLLGHNDFKTRDRAHVLLAKYREPAIPAILRGESHADPEIRARCRILSRSWWEKNAYRLAAEWKPTNWSCWPWIDACGDPSADVMFYVNLAMAKGISADSPRWEAWQEATRLWVADMIAARVDPEPKLREMCRAHRNWPNFPLARQPEEPVFTKGVR